MYKSYRKIIVAPLEECFLLLQELRSRQFLSLGSRKVNELISLDVYGALENFSNVGLEFIFGMAFSVFCLCLQLFPFFSLDEKTLTEDTRFGIDVQASWEKNRPPLQRFISDRQAGLFVFPI